MADVFMSLTKADGGNKPVAVNLRAIAYIERIESGTLIHFSEMEEDCIPVTDDYDSVLQRLGSYR